MALSVSNLTVSGPCVATSFAGAGSGVTTLDAGNVASGVLPVSRGGTGVGSMAQDRMVTGGAGGTGPFRSASNVYYDASTGFLGVGRTPAYAMDVNGVVNASSYRGIGMNLTNLTATNVTNGILKGAQGGTGVNVGFVPYGAVFLGGTSALAVGYADSFMYDISTNRMGLGTSAPVSKMDVRGGDATFDGMVQGIPGGDLRLRSRVALTDASGAAQWTIDASAGSLAFVDGSGVARLSVSSTRGVSASPMAWGIFRFDVATMAAYGTVNALWTSMDGSGITLADAGATMVLANPGVYSIQVTLGVNTNVTSSLTMRLKRWNGSAYVDAQGDRQYGSWSAGVSAARFFFLYNATAANEKVQFTLQSDANVTMGFLTDVMWSRAMVKHKSC